MYEPAPALCPAPTSHLLGLLCRLWAGQVAGLAAWQFPECLLEELEELLLLINTQATLGEFLIGIWGMQRLHSQAAGLFLVLSTNTAPPPP